MSSENRAGERWAARRPACRGVGVGLVGVAAAASLALGGGTTHASGDVYLGVFDSTKICDNVSTLMNRFDPDNHYYCSGGKLFVAVSRAELDVIRSVGTTA